MGGTVDPKTGEIVWDLHVPVAEQLAHYRGHPPRAIAALRATPIEVDFAFDGHGEPVNAVFALACPCGGTRFTATCGLDGEEISAPIALECATCDVMHEIFDAAAHGYDAELNVLDVDEPEGFDDLVSPEVAAPHEIVVRYEYPSDHLGNGEWPGREQDLFSWFTLLARHPTSGKLAFLFDAECA